MKIPRIGYPDGSIPFHCHRPASTPFRQRAARTRVREGKTLVIERAIMLRRTTIALPELAAEASASQGRHHRHRGVPQATRAPPRNYLLRFPLSMAQDSDPVDNGLTSPALRGLAGYVTWIVNASPGVKRKTTGASEGDRS